jgi:hypothetical protein
MNIVQRKKWDKQNTVLDLPIFLDLDLDLDICEENTHDTHTHTQYKSLQLELISKQSNEIHNKKTIAISRWRLRTHKQCIVNYDKRTKKNIIISNVIQNGLQTD